MPAGLLTRQTLSSTEAKFKASERDQASSTASTSPTAGRGAQATRHSPKTLATCRVPGRAAAEGGLLPALQSPAEVSS